MPTVINASTNDGYQASGLSTSWDSTHDAVGQLAPDTNNSTDGFNGVRYEYVTGRGAVRYYLVRSFFDFDTSGVNAKPTAATFNFTASANASATPVIVAKSGHDPSTPLDDWFSTWITGQGITLSGWGLGDVTAYSSATSVASAGSVTSIELTLDAREDMLDLSVFKICLLHAEDLLDQAPTSGLQRTGMIWSDNGSSQPNLSYTPGTAAVTDNATFFGANF